MNAENLQLFTCMVLAHFTMFGKKKELQSMDHVKYFSNLLPSDIHRREVNDFI